MQEMVMNRKKGQVPSHLTPAPRSFFDTASLPRLPVFSLLCKTHQSVKLSPSGDWQSRPTVGVRAWATTPVSTLLKVLGQIRLKLDKQCNLQTFPLMLNTMQLVTSLQDWTQRSPHDQRTLVCSTFDYTSLSTNITWYNVLRPWE